jgi:hypothetical protein
MKKVVISIAAAGLVCSANAADLVNKDAQFLFGQEEANVAVMADVEMTQTDGQVLEILGAVTAPAKALPVVGTVVSMLPTDMLSLDALPVAGLLSGDLLGGGLPLNVLGGGLPLSSDIMGSLLSTAAGLPIVGDMIGALPVQVFTPKMLFGMGSSLPMVGSMLINGMVIDTANDMLPVRLSHINLSKDIPVVSPLLSGNLLGGGLPLVGGLGGGLPTDLLSLDSLPLLGMLDGGLPLSTDLLGPVLSLADMVPVVGTVLP